MSKPVTYADRAKRYAERVVSGKIPAAKPTKLACQRHLADLKRAGRKSFAYRFDADAAERVCRFVELLPHVKGRWARAGEKIRLEDWQCFIVCSVFGWLQKSNGLRRFRRAYIEVARKNAKSTLTAAVGLYMLVADGEHGAEIYSGAGSEKQAWEVFGPARLMAKQTPELLAAYGVVVGAKNLSVPGTASKFEPIIGKPGDGASPSFSITDEYHEHATEEQYDTMLTGMGAREQPLSWVITTAGSDTAGPCFALRSEVMEVLEGTVRNDQLFGLIYTIEEENDDWTTEKALRKANPNYDVSVSAEYLKNQIRDAINSPRKQATAKTKHFCVWVTAAAPYLNAEKWARAADPKLDPVQFLGEPCWLGLDLAAKLDLAAAVRVFVRSVDGTDHYYAFLRAYIPEERSKEPDKKHYAGWVETGDLIATPGNITDYDQIEADLIDDAERFRVVEVRLDPWNATQIGTHLTNHGLQVVEVPQTVVHLSDPMKWVEALIEDGRLHHDGNKVFAWGVGNLSAKADRNDNVFPRKEHPEKKIDPALALIMAIAGAKVGEAESMYETAGLTLI